MVSRFPTDFPSASVARVEAARVRAALELEEAKQRLVRLDEYEAQLRKYVLRVFSVFAQEALELGRQGLWAVNRVDSECREFLEHVTLQAQLYWGYDQRERAIVPMADARFGHVLPEVWREFQTSSEWRSYQEGLLKVAELQSSNKTPAPSNVASALRQSRTNDTPQTATSSGKIGTKPPRRSARYEGIDQALREVAKAHPVSHEEVFRLLDRRTKVPNAKPFEGFHNWSDGYKRNPAAARIWLSKAWGRLHLPPFPRGPKK